MGRDAASAGHPQMQWRPVDLIAVSVWAAAIVGASILWNQWTLSNSDLPDPIALGLIVVMFVGLPIVFGAFAGLLIRRDGRWFELLLLAGVGSASVAFGLVAQWVNDPRSCDPSPCDTAFSVGGILIFFVCYLPFLAGAGIGRGVDVLVRHTRWAGTTRAE